MQQSTRENIRGRNASQLHNRRKTSKYVWGMTNVRVLRHNAASVGINMDSLGLTKH